MQNGSTQTDRPSYDEWARSTVRRTWSEAEPPDGWIKPLAMLGSAMVYALLEIARAIRETHAAS